MINNRVATGYQYNSYSSQIASAMDRLTRLQGQITSGHRFENMHDDPLAAAQVIDIASLKSRYQQFDSNLAVAKDYLGNADSTLKSVTDLVNSANSIALQGANSTTDTATRQNLVSQVGQLQDQIVRLGNTQLSNGNYLFAGQQSTTKPFSAGSGTLAFAGDNEAVKVETRPGERLQVNVPNAAQTFTDIYNRLETLKKNLASGDSTALQTSIGDIKSSLDTVVGLRGDAGAVMQTVTRLSDDNSRRIDDLTKQASDTQDVDMADALTQYQSAQVGYQASLQVIASANKFSLLDFLR